MRTVEEYLEYEGECRRLAEKTTRPEDKRALEVMAAAWARLVASQKAQMMKASRPRRQKSRG